MHGRHPNSPVLDPGLRTDSRAPEYEYVELRPRPERPVNRRPLILLGGLVVVVAAIAVIVGGGSSGDGQVTVLAAPEDAAPAADQRGDGERASSHRA